MSYAAHPWLLLPLQARLASLARGFADGTAPIPQRYWRLSRWWNFWGVIAAALPLATVYFMVYKGAA
jgi:uncharacterized membrane protein